MNDHGRHVADDDSILNGELPSDADLGQADDGAEAAASSAVDPDDETSAPALGNGRHANATAPKSEDSPESSD